MISGGCRRCWMYSSRIILLSSGRRPSISYLYKKLHMIIQFIPGQRLFAGLFAVVMMTACNNEPKQPATATGAGNDSSGIKEEQIAFTADSANLHAFVVYNDSVKGKKPAVIVIPEWWGLNDYPRMRAKMLAGLGYVAMALDMYGD